MTALHYCAAKDRDECTTLLVRNALYTSFVVTTSVLMHYENAPIQYTVIFHGCKNGYFQIKNCDIFLIFAQNIDRGY